MTSALPLSNGQRDVLRRREEEVEDLYTGIPWLHGPAGLCETVLA